MPSPIAKKRRYARSIRRATIPPMVAMGLLALFLVIQVSNLRKAVEEVNQSDLVIQHSTQLLKLAVDMETGQRGFLLVDDEEFLKPFKDARTPILKELATIRNGVVINAQQREHLTAIGETLAAWVAHADKEIQLKKTADFRNAE